MNVYLKWTRCPLNFWGQLLFRGRSTCASPIALTSGWLFESPRDFSVFLRALLAFPDFGFWIVERNYQFVRARTKNGIGDLVSDNSFDNLEIFVFSRRMSRSLKLRDPNRKLSFLAREAIEDRDIIKCRVTYIETLKLRIVLLWRRWRRSMTESRNKRHIHIHMYTYTHQVTKRNTTHRDCDSSRSIRI